MLKLEFNYSLSPGTCGRVCGQLWTAFGWEREPKLWVNMDIAYLEAGSVLRIRMKRKQCISCRKLVISYEVVLD